MCVTTIFVSSRIKKNAVLNFYLKFQSPTDFHLGKCISSLCWVFKCLQFLYHMVYVMAKVDKTIMGNNIIGNPLLINAITQFFNPSRITTELQKWKYIIKLDVDFVMSNDIRFEKDFTNLKVIVWNQIDAFLLFFSKSINHLKTFLTNHFKRSNMRMLHQTLVI